MFYSYCATLVDRDGYPLPSEAKFISTSDPHKANDIIVGKDGNLYRIDFAIA